MAVCGLRVMRTLLICCVASTIAIIISGMMWSAYKRYESFSDTYQGQTVRSYFESYVADIIEKGEMKSKNGTYIDGRNLTAVVHQYKNLLKKLTTTDLKYNISNIKPKELNLLPQNILDDEQFKIMLKRISVSREACLSKDQELSAPMDPLRLLQEEEHHLIICRNIQASSTTLSTYANVLHMYSVLNKYLTVLHGITDHYLLRSYKFPKFTDKDKHNVSVINNFSFAAVRHPFQRALLGYHKNILSTNYYSNTLPNLYSDMLKYSYLSPKEAKTFLMTQLSENGTKSFLLRNLTCSPTLSDSPSDETVVTEHKLLKPTFRGYVLGVVSSMLVCNGRVDCLLQIESHYRSQTIKCNPCDVNYDAIVKVESLAEDIKFIENVLGLPPAYNVLQRLIASNPKEIEKSISVDNILFGSNVRLRRSAEDGVVAANVTESNQAYPEYIAQLSEYELSLLYTVYYNDFKVFGYDPCEGLN